MYPPTLKSESFTILKGRIQGASGKGCYEMCKVLTNDTRLERGPKKQHPLRPGRRATSRTIPRPRPKPPQNLQRKIPCKLGSKQQRRMTRTYLPVAELEVQHCVLFHTTTQAQFTEPSSEATATGLCLLWKSQRGNLIAHPACDSLPKDLKRPCDR